MHAIPCLKSWCMTTISEIRENGEGAMFLACLHAISRSVFHAIACLKCMLFHASNPDVLSSLARAKRAERAWCIWSVDTQFLWLFLMLFDILNPCYSMSLILMYGDHLRGRRDRRQRDVVGLLTRNVSVDILCFLMSQIHAILYLKSWCMTRISEVSIWVEN